MLDGKVFHSHTALAEGLRELFKQLEQRLLLGSPLNVYLAGGMAVHLYTASRVTTDVDAEFGGRVHIPNDLMVEVTLENGVQQVIYLDTNYNSTFALMHEDYQADSIPVDLGLEHIRVHVLHRWTWQSVKYRGFQTTTATTYGSSCDWVSQLPTRSSNALAHLWTALSAVRPCCYTTFATRLRLRERR